MYWALDHPRAFIVISILLAALTGIGVFSELLQPIWLFIVPFGVALVLFVASLLRFLITQDVPEGYRRESASRA